MQPNFLDERMWEKWSYNYFDQFLTPCTSFFELFSLVSFHACDLCMGCLSQALCYLVELTFNFSKCQTYIT